MPRWIYPAIAAFLAIYVVVMLIAGEPVWIVPGVILAAIVLAYAAFNDALSRRQLAAHDGDPLAVQRDNEDPIPSTHLIPDDETAAGDTPEAHDEISPHDLPIDHPGRQEAEAQAGGPGGTTTGNAEGAQGGRDGS
jgi:hypothetical protein